MLALLVGCGLRRAELLSLAVDQIEQREGRRRTVPAGRPVDRWIDRCCAVRQALLLYVRAWVSSAAEDQEGTVGCDLRVDVHMLAIAERKRLGGLVNSIMVFGGEQALAPISRDVGEVERTIRRDARLPNGVANVG